MAFGNGKKTMFGKVFSCDPIQIHHMLAQLSATPAPPPPPLPRPSFPWERPQSPELKHRWQRRTSRGSFLRIFLTDFFLGKNHPYFPIRPIDDRMHDITDYFLRPR